MTWEQIWKWVKSHVVPLPAEPDTVKPKQEDPQSVGIGIRWKF